MDRRQQSASELSFKSVKKLIGTMIEVIKPPTTEE